MAVFTINGVEIPAPLEFSCDRMALDSEETGRDQSGNMFRDVITQKRKWNGIKWGPLTSAEIKTILDAVEPAFFTLTAPDPKAGGMVTVTAYVGDRTAPVYTMYGNETRWASLSMSFIER